MKYLDKTFWKMSLLFVLIILLTLGAVYGLKKYDQNRPIDRINS
jgi:hypothetical protein